MARFVSAAAFAAAFFTVAAFAVGPHEAVDPQQTGAIEMADHQYVGMWVTENGHIRHELLANGRYDEARGNRQSAYQGRYRLEGDHIEYVDDTGFTADGDFRDGILYHAGMVLYRER